MNLQCPVCGFKESDQAFRQFSIDLTNRMEGDPDVPRNELWLVACPKCGVVFKPKEQ